MAMSPGVVTPSFELAQKQLEMLREIVPQLSRLLLLYGNGVTSSMTCSYSG
jgi:hypothetical protein